MTLDHASYSLAALPRSITSAASALTGRREHRARTLVHAILAAGVGLLAWFLAFLAVFAAVRGIFYPLLDSESYQHSWGGPTMAGAWAVHLLALLLLPLFGLVIAAIGRLQARLTGRLMDGQGPIWPMPVAALLAIGGGFLFVSWLNQL